MSQIKKQEKAESYPNDELFAHLPKSFQVLASFVAKISNERCPAKTGQPEHTQDDGNALVT